MPRGPRERITASVIRNVVSVASISGAPRIAPTPISSFTAGFAVPPASASSGTIVSGSAVPTAANSEPVTPSEIFRRSPRCSSALVKTSAATRMTISMTASSTNMNVMRHLRRHACGRRRNAGRGWRGTWGLRGRTLTNHGTSADVRPGTTRCADGLARPIRLNAPRPQAECVDAFAFRRRKAGYSPKTKGSLAERVAFDKHSFRTALSGRWVWGDAE
ncbi:hypothetical protein BCEP4_220054 [Burkholderia cepacia]|nr:hypothetical protein BCEP4_220054 [Burkholderia cepacia]